MSTLFEYGSPNCILCPGEGACSQERHDKYDEEVQRKVHKFCCTKTHRDPRCLDDYAHDDITRPARGSG